MDIDSGSTVVLANDWERLVRVSFSPLSSRADSSRPSAVDKTNKDMLSGLKGLDGQPKPTRKKAKDPLARRV